ncbi:MAG TPA: SDR family oxidoreductase [Acidimicrobiales bacterium]|nr:SDR family oxidoreductase [Acidimicrobiales bacterium]
MERLNGKVALVTGAGTGIGAAIARRFAAEGATVWVNDLRADAAEEVAQSVGGRAVPADVADVHAVQCMFATVAAAGRLDILVNNAGITGLEGDPDRVDRMHARVQAQMAETLAGGPITSHDDSTLEMSDDTWRRVLGVHLDGTFFCCRAALATMAPQMSGAIINMGSIMGTSGGGGLAYSAAKAGIMGLTRTLAREVVTRNIRVNAIAPGWIETALTEPLGPLLPLLAAQTPMRRLGEPDDVAWAAVYLASDESKFVTGQVLSPNGGWYMSQ